MLRIYNSPAAPISRRSPPLYYRTGSHRLDTARRPSVGREEWARRESSSGAGGARSRDPEGNPPLSAMKPHGSLIPGNPSGPITAHNSVTRPSQPPVSASLCALVFKMTGGGRGSNSTRWPRPAQAQAPAWTEGHRLWPSTRLPPACSSPEGQRRKQNNRTRGLQGRNRNPPGGQAHRFRHLGNLSIKRPPPSRLSSLYGN